MEATTSSSAFYLPGNEAISLWTEMRMRHSKDQSLITELAKMELQPKSHNWGKNNLNETVTSTPAHHSLTRIRIEDYLPSVISELSKKMMINFEDLGFADEEDFELLELADFMGLSDRTIEFFAQRCAAHLDGCINEWRRPFDAAWEKVIWQHISSPTSNCTGRFAHESLYCQEAVELSRLVETRDLHFSPIHIRYLAAHVQDLLSLLCLQLAELPSGQRFIKESDLRCHWKKYYDKYLPENTPHTINHFLEGICRSQRHEMLPIIYLLLKFCDFEGASVTLYLNDIPPEFLRVIEGNPTIAAVHFKKTCQLHCTDQGSKAIRQMQRAHRLRVTAILKHELNEGLQWELEFSSQPTELKTLSLDSEKPNNAPMLQIIEPFVDSLEDLTIGNNIPHIDKACTIFEKVKNPPLKSLTLRSLDNELPYLQRFFQLLPNLQALYCEAAIERIHDIFAIIVLTRKQGALDNLKNVFIINKKEKEPAGVESELKNLGISYHYIRP